MDHQHVHPFHTITSYTIHPNNTIATHKNSLKQLLLTTSLLDTNPEEATAIISPWWIRWHGIRHVITDREDFSSNTNTCLLLITL